MSAITPPEASILAIIAQYSESLGPDAQDEMQGLARELTTENAKKVAGFLLSPERLNEDMSTVSEDELEAFDQARSIREWAKLNEAPVS